MATPVKSYLVELRENKELLALNNALDDFFERESKTATCCNKAFDELCKVIEGKKFEAKAEEVVSSLLEDIFNQEILKTSKLPASSISLASAPIVLPPNPTGISNRGNTCFMASALQFLASSDAYFEDISRPIVFNGENAALKTALRSDLAILLAEIRKGDGANSALIQEHFKQIHDNPLITGQGPMRFVKGAQDDAFSFMTHLLTQIEVQAEDDHKLVQKKKIIAGSDTSYVYGRGTGDDKPFIELTTSFAYQGALGQSTTFQSLIDNLQGSAEEVDNFTYNGTRPKETVIVGSCFTHPDIDQLEEMPFVLPRVLKTRTGLASYNLTKLKGSITGLLDDFTLTVKNERDGRNYQVRFRATSFIVHLGDSALGGHYVEIERKADGDFLYKSDGDIRVINQAEALRFLEKGAQVVNASCIDRVVIA